MDDDGEEQRPGPGLLEVMSIRLLLGIALCAAAVPPAAAGDIAADVLVELPAVVDEVMDDWKVPGAAVAVVRDGEIIFTGGFGLRDLARRREVTANTIFAVASTTKAFTAAAMGMLVDEGSVKLDQPVIAYLPDFELRDPHTTSAITVRDLLAHRSGYRRHDALWYRSDASRDELISRLRFLQPAADLRERFYYNNLMYMVAGRVVGRVTGGTWEQFVQQRIFNPLEMARSSFGTPPLDTAADVAMPYRLDSDGELIGALPYDGWAIGPASSICSTANDMARWVQLMLGMGALDGRRLIAADTVREMFSPQMAISNLGAREMPIATYGMGWFVQTYRGHLMVWHTGTIDGYYAMVALLPFDGLGVAILTNRTNHSMPEIVSRWIFDRYLGLPEINWNTIFELQEGAVVKAQRDALAAREAIRRPDTAPGAALSDLAGRYRHPAYGDFQIDLDGERLIATFHGMAGPLQYFHEDAFVFDLVPYEIRDEIIVRFLYGPDGAVLSLAASMQDGTAPVVFIRLAEVGEAEGSGQ